MPKSDKNAHPKADDAPREEDQAPRPFTDYLQEYARDNPGTACLWCLGIGFVLGWKLKPW